MTAVPTVPDVQLHADEFRIDVELVRGLLERQMPELAGLTPVRVETSGTANVVFRLGDDLVVRLPRAPDFAGGPEREARWMPVFTDRLPIHVPTHHRLGAPSEGYPSHWSVLEWVEGTPADASTVDDLDRAAVALGEFVTALRGVSTEGAPTDGNYRAFGLGNVDTDFRRWSERLPPDIDRTAVGRVWESCLAVRAWDGRPSWLHTDLRGGNLITRSGGIVAVIDWEGCTVGDPSADHLAAWWLFDAESRETFRAASGADDGTWLRAMGWALHMGVAAIPYYADSNPVFVERARRAVDEILVDFEEWPRSRRVR
jgi:aminoglycoside phosphotransferase (APT) family kinase protein